MIESSFTNLLLGDFFMKQFFRKWQVFLLLSLIFSTVSLFGSTFDLEKKCVNWSSVGVVNPLHLSRQDVSIQKIPGLPTFVPTLQYDGVSNRWAFNIPMGMYGTEYIYTVAVGGQQSSLYDMLELNLPTGSERYKWDVELDLQDTVPATPFAGQEKGVKVFRGEDVNNEYDFDRRIIKRYGKDGSVMHFEIKTVNGGGLKWILLPLLHQDRYGNKIEFDFLTRSGVSLLESEDYVFDDLKTIVIKNPKREDLIIESSYLENLMPFNGGESNAEFSVTVRTSRSNSQKAIYNFKNNYLKSVEIFKGGALERVDSYTYTGENDEFASYDHDMYPNPERLEPLFSRKMYTGSVKITTSEHGQNAYTKYSISNSILNSIEQKVWDGAKSKIYKTYFDQKWWKNGTWEDFSWQFQSLGYLGYGTTVLPYKELSQNEDNQKLIITHKEIGSDGAEKLVRYEEKIFNGWGKEKEIKVCLSNSSDPDCSIKKIEYNSKSQPTKITNYQGETKLYPEKKIEYDYYGNITKTEECASASNCRSKQISYGRYNKPSNHNFHIFPRNISFPDGRKTIYAYDYDETPTNDLNRDYIGNQRFGNIVKEEHLGNNSLLEEILIYSYDDKGRLTKQGYVEDKSDSSYTKFYRKGFDYDSTGRVYADYSLIDGQKRLENRYNHDSYGRKIAERSAAGVITLYEYNGADQVVKTHFGCTDYNEDSCDHFREYDYDKLGNLTRTDYRDYYDTSKEGKIKKTTFPIDLTKKLTTVYDSRGLAVKTCKAFFGAKETFGWHNTSCITVDHDMFGNIITKEEKGNVREIKYNHLNKAIEVKENGIILEKSGYRGDGKIQFLCNRYAVNNSDSFKCNASTPSNKKMETKYDGYGRVVETIDPFGQRIVNSYDLADRKLSTITYDKNGTRTSEVENVYDGLGRFHKKIDHTFVPSDTSKPEIESETVYKYDKAGNVAEVTDSLGNITANTYDKYNRLYKVVNVDGDDISSTTVYVYSVGTPQTRAGRLARIVHEEGGRIINTYFDYDIMGRTIRTCKESEGEKRCSYTVYNTGGQVIWTADEESSVDSTVSWWDDSYGDIFAETEEHFGNETFYHYNRAGDLAFVSYKMTQDGQGGSVLDAINPYITVKYNYDDFGRIAEKINDKGGKTEYKYYSTGNGKGKLSSLTIGGIQKYEYAYNSKGDVVETTWTETGSAPLTVALGLDSYGRVERRSTSGNSDRHIVQTYTYDDRNLLKTATEGDYTVYREYDSDGNVYREQINDNPSVYKWKRDARTTLLQYPNGKKKLTGIMDGRLNAIAYGSDNIASYRYTDGKLSSIMKGNGVEERFGYNKWNNLVRKAISKQYDSNGKPENAVAHYNYDYTRSWHLNEKTDLVENRTENYTYDSYYRLNDVSYGNGETESFKLDGVHNIVESKKNSETTKWIVDALNRVQGKEGAEKAEYMYDERNNLALEENGNVLRSYEYDALNRLRKVYKNDGKNSKGVSLDKITLDSIATDHQLMDTFETKTGKFLATYREEGSKARLKFYKIMNDGTLTDAAYENAGWRTGITNFFKYTIAEGTVLNMYRASDGYIYSWVVNADGTWKKTIRNKNWAANTIKIFPVKRGNKNFLMFYKTDGKIIVYPLNTDGTLGKYADNSFIGHGFTNLEEINKDGESGILGYNKNTGDIKIWKVNDNGSINETPFFENTWDRGISQIKLFENGNDLFLMTYKESSGLNYVFGVNNFGMSSKRGLFFLASSKNIGSQYSFIVPAGSSVDGYLYAYKDDGKLDILDFEQKIEYEYDAFNRRVVKKVGQKEHLYFYDDWNVVTEKVKTAGKYVENFNYIDNGMDNHIAVAVTAMDNPSTEKLYYYHKDERGNVIAITDSNGSPKATYRYGVYGRFLKKEESALPFENNFYWGGSYLDKETGLYWMRNRYYHIGLKRFINQDPIGIWGDANNLGNGFAYVAGMVIEHTDPTGLFFSPSNPKNWYRVGKFVFMVFSLAGSTAAVVSLYRDWNGKKVHNDAILVSHGREAGDNGVENKHGEKEYKWSGTTGDETVVHGKETEHKDGSKTRSFKKDGKVIKERTDADGTKTRDVYTKKGEKTVDVKKTANSPVQKKRLVVVCKQKQVLNPVTNEWVDSGKEECTCQESMPSTTPGEAKPMGPDDANDKMQNYFMNQLLKEILLKKGIGGGSIGDDEYWEIANDDYQRSPATQFVHNPFYKGKDPLKEVYWKVDRDDTGRPVIWRNPLAPTPYVDSRPVWEKLASQGVIYGDQPDPAPFMPTFGGGSFMPAY